MYDPNPVRDCVEEGALEKLSDVTELRFEK